MSADRPTTQHRPSSSPYLLSPGAYDDDATTIRALSDQESDSEDDQLMEASRSTLDLVQHDRTVLEEEEERERLLIRAKSSPTDGLRRIFGANPHDNGSFSVKIGKRDRSKRRRRELAALTSDRRRRRSSAQSNNDAMNLGEDDELMYEMEEGVCKAIDSDDDSRSESTVSSIFSDLDPRDIGSRGYCGSDSSCRVVSLITFAILILFSLLYLGAYKASSGYRISHHQPPNTISNGTSLFLPTTILISLDGFRADFLTRGLTPTLNSFIANGISPKYMLPSFPSVTFPNHFTLVTGLYPESHGIVGNTFWDPELKDDFYYTKPEKSMQPKWWQAEPIWATAEKQGVKTAIHMWPGSEAHIMGIEPTFLDKYNGSEALPRKVDRILELIDLPGEKDADIPPTITQRRPQLIAAYVPNVDAAGHTFGPNSTEIRTTISRVDKMLASILQGLESRNLTNVVNIVVVSDHGMATTSVDRLVQLEDLVDLNLVERIDGWPLRGLVPKRKEDIQLLYEQAKNHTAFMGFDDYLEIYTRETMPERYHFSKNDRIAPLWIIPKAGWAIVERPDFDVKLAQKEGKAYHPMGIHGYDHEHPLMRAIFVARGPSFPHKANSRVQEFQNIEVYNIVCDSLRVKPRPNNGTLRLPLKPVGLHSDGKTPPIENLDDQDPPKSTSSKTPVSTRSPVLQPTTAAGHAGIPPPPPPTATQQSQGRPSSIIDRIIDKVKGWASDIFGFVGLG
ncbi:type I phosphodiesterase/nucleotide pyrophosphatase [Trichophyton equinum CBS 127.97]|uniref:Type I phosphodiesterase/nucleotide pyrophosphatase n=1 Tax=Trichophyton equinum (strain ATCC MYA-4606 / CBS 127.97) TaxID=559882 RepID=F2Q625_TRIEC|nr:type I phosphodiesterase/nucleotide pyrophosphatase [Trichophyton equinum CBS 127.97]